MSVASITPSAVLNGRLNQKQTRRPSFMIEPPDEEPFKLDSGFLSGYKSKSPNFGYNGLGEFVFYRTYSRIKADGKKESFLDVLTRVVEGCYEIQRRHCRHIHVPWDYDKALISAHEMFQRMWQFKFLPPGRGMWCMGTPFMWERGSAALNNCGFVSTEDIAMDPAEPFAFLMDMSMLGVGIGFDTRGANKVGILRPERHITKHVVLDSREGWVDSVRALIDSFTRHTTHGLVEFDYSGVRIAGTPIRGFGGVASGPDNLASLHEMLRDFFVARIGRAMTSVDIVDIMNMIGACVVAGNVRRTAEIAFGDADDFLYTNMKNPCLGLESKEVTTFVAVTGRIFRDQLAINPKAIVVTTTDEFEATRRALNQERANMKEGMPGDRSELPPVAPLHLQKSVDTWNTMNKYRWASNNSLFAHVGMDYTGPAASTGINGEPGYVWLENMRDFGRMVDGRQPGIDCRVAGTNPCGEQSLESYELCNLVETFPSYNEDADDYLRTLKFAYLYAKTVTLLPTHNARTNSVTLRNRRIGLSQSGIIAAFEKFGRRKILRDFCDAGYHEVKRWDNIYSDWLCVGRSIKVTSVKPSGTISLVTGVPPGIHYPLSKAYWRHVRVSWQDPLVAIAKEGGYFIEPAATDKATAVIRFGVDESNLPSVDDVTIWQQVTNVVDYQRYWADNQPSCTVQIKPHEANQVKPILEAFDDQLKCISFLPQDHGYPQAPYVPAPPDEVRDYIARCKPIDFAKYMNKEAEGSKYCDSDKCMLTQ